MAQLGLQQLYRESTFVDSLEFTTENLSVVIIGASGDLAKKKVRRFLPVPLPKYLLGMRA
jgi:hypothetical protein